MTFVVTLIALLIERFFDWSHLRHWGWYATYQRNMTQRLSGKASATVVFAAVIVPLLLAVALIGWVLKGWMYGLGSLVFQLIVLLYCLGPQNLWADAFACISALKQGDTQAASERMKTSFGAEGASEQSLYRSLLNHIFIEANRRVFVVVFWYLILGPLGAVLCRCVTLSASHLPEFESAPDVSQCARTAEGVLDWIPVRLFTFTLALGGRFSQVFKLLRKQFMHGVDSNVPMLTECGSAALGADDVTVSTDGSLVKGAIHLLDRAFVILLVVVALLVLKF